MKAANFICTTCGKGFKTNDDLKFHKITHSEDKPFSCDLCDSKFKRKGALTKHKRLYHTEKEFFDCEECGLTFEGTKKFEKHLDEAHSGEARKKKFAKPIVCFLCDTDFLTAGDLNTHGHKNHSPLVCPYCSKNY
jgi:uncharacterized Zn-finger protein